MIAERQLGWTRDRGWCCDDWKQKSGSVTGRCTRIGHSTIYDVDSCGRKISSQGWMREAESLVSDDRTAFFMFALVLTSTLSSTVQAHKALLGILRRKEQSVGIDVRASSSRHATTGHRQQWLWRHLLRRLHHHHLLLTSCAVTADEFQKGERGGADNFWNGDGRQTQRMSERFRVLEVKIIALEDLKSRWSIACRTELAKIWLQTRWRIDQ